MKIKILGAAHEVGRSGFLVNCGNTNFLLDYGMLLRRRGDAPLYPLHVKPKDIDAIIISHAHLDHSGNIPSLFISGHNAVYATPPTLELSRLLIEDMLKIESKFHLFGNNEVNMMFQNSKKLKYNEKIKINNSSFELRMSGHVIGGSTVILESEKKRLFYTGDINPNGSSLLCKADFNVGKIDVLITESTYSQVEQVPRKTSENKLIEFANEVIDRKGILFIPSFSVERSQEIACVFRKNKFEHKILMDGMALKVNEIIFKYPKYLRDSKIFADSIDHVTQIRNHRDRKKALEEPCVVISPAGMLVGGNAVYYLHKLAFNSNNGIALVSYQSEGTQGRQLLETGKISMHGEATSVCADVRSFEFSGHGDRNALFDMISKVEGNPKVLTVHGDNRSCDIFAKEINERFGLETYSPKIGDIYTF